MGFTLVKKNWEKFAPWDQTSRVPFFIHAPGISKDGKRCQQAVTLTDIHPTLCELAKIHIPKKRDGKSLVKHLKAPNIITDKTSLISFQFWGEKAPSHAVSDDKHRYIFYGNGFKELYDLENDPHEFKNLARDENYSEIKNKLKKINSTEYSNNEKNS